MTLSDDDVPIVPKQSAPAEDDDSPRRPDQEDGDGNRLPEGVKKEIVIEAASHYQVARKKPKYRDEVEVHYFSVLESDGSQFDSSREAGKPFKFTLGQGQVIKGWDLAVATMMKGEIAKFTIAPEYAYGANGSPPKIPMNETLIFEIELVDWVSKDDLFSDGGVIQSLIKEGGCIDGKNYADGYKKPRLNGEVLISYKVTLEDGTVAEEKANLEYKVGSGSAGKLSQAIDKALMGMVKDGNVTLKCMPKYAYDDGNTVMIDLTLHQLYENTDVSFMKDKSVMKKQIKEGEGYQYARDLYKVTLTVDNVTAAGESVLANGKSVEFIVGEGEVCDVLECTCLRMKKGEHAIVTCTSPELAVCERLGLKEGLAAPIIFALEMTEFEDDEKRVHWWKANDEERVNIAKQRKLSGGALFKRNRMWLAQARYDVITRMFLNTDKIQDEKVKAEAVELKRDCELNKAMCLLKLGDYEGAKKSCTTVLDRHDSKNIKALFRRATALVELKDYNPAMDDLKRLLEIQEDNADAKRLLQKAVRLQKEVDKQIKGMYAKMF